MIARDPKTVAEALRNLWVHREQYGRVRSMVRLYGISRPALYRLEGRFLESIGQRRRPRSPRSVAAHSERLQGEEIARLKSEKARLQIQVDQLRDEKLNTLRRTQFWLIGLGLPARVIARLLRECFRVRSNRTDILHLTQQYARRATQLMQDYFWPAARDVDLDEVFIEGLPLLIASEPRGLTILKTSLEQERTVVTWGAFLRDLPQLQRTTSDRGQAIRGAVARHGIRNVQSDIFHPIMLWRDELAMMETRCYSLMEQEELLRQRLAKTRRRGRDCRGHAVRLHTVAQRTREAIACFDELEAAVHLAVDALRFTTAQGTFNSPAQARADLQFAKTWIHAHLPSGWSKVKRSLDDEALLTFLADLQAAVPSVCVDAPTPADRLYVLVTLARLWEDQAQRRYRAKPVRIPDPILQKLQSCCANLPEVQRQLFHLLDHLHRASSGVECINSRVGFYRYSNPFPVFASALGLMFRWFAAGGPKVIPTKDEMINGFGLDVVRHDIGAKRMVLKNRNDAHPANAWSFVVSSFPNCERACAYLSQYRLKREDVLWVRFAAEDWEFDYEKTVQPHFTYHDVRGTAFRQPPANEHWQRCHGLPQNPPRGVEVHPSRNRLAGSRSAVLGVVFAYLRHDPPGTAGVA